MEVAAAPGAPFVVLLKYGEIETVEICVEGETKNIKRFQMRMK